MKEQIAYASFIKASHSVLDEARKNAGNTDSLVRAMVDKIVEANIPRLQDDVQGPRGFEIEHLRLERTQKVIKSFGFSENDSGHILAKILIGHGEVRHDHFDPAVAAEKIHAELAKNPMVAINWQLKTITEDVPQENRPLVEKLQTLTQVLEQLDRAASNIELQTMPDYAAGGGQLQTRLGLRKWADRNPGELNAEAAADAIVSSQNVPAPVRNFAQAVLKAARKANLNEAMKAMTGEGVA